MKAAFQKLGKSYHHSLDTSRHSPTLRQVAFRATGDSRQLTAKVKTYNLPPSMIAMLTFKKIERQ